MRVAPHKRKAGVTRIGPGDWCRWRARNDSNVRPRIRSEEVRESKLTKCPVLAGVNEPKKSRHGVRKARAEVATYADCTESQMMAMFGWTDPKMPAHYTAKANWEKLRVSGMDKIVAFDQSQSFKDFMPVPKTNRVRTEW
jgi:hypothetical protein